VLAGVAAAQSADNRAPISNMPAVKIDGKIEKVHAAPQQGMPYLEVLHQDKRTKVILGALRYLMENDFNPKAGDTVIVTGYQAGEDVVASLVELPGSKKQLRLRDENGRPLWRGGRQGKKRS
jgi:hypothetical protein